MKPSATILLDSVSTDNVRLTTMEVTMHRFVLAEFNTHRVFSRNSASSRAIPFPKMKERVMNDLAFPVHWGAEQKGMQSGERLGGTDELIISEHWRAARLQAVNYAEYCNKQGLHKSVANRLIEPFMWHTVIVTSTYWENFFAQRCDAQAQPEMKAAADAMLQAFKESEPRLLVTGEWHTPLMRPDDEIDIERHSEQIVGNTDSTASVNETCIELRKRISTARCARSSYLSHHGVRDIAEDLKLFEKLTTYMHPSPFEHIATPCTHMDAIQQYFDEGPPHLELRCHQWGNFYGWHQFRKSVPGENRSFDYTAE